MRCETESGRQASPKLEAKTHLLYRVCPNWSLLPLEAVLFMVDLQGRQRSRVER